MSEYSVPMLAARLYEPLLGRVLAGLRHEVLGLLPQQGKVLDCCCGPGGLLRLLSGQPLGLDMDKTMLTMAQKHAPHAVLLRGDAAWLPFKDHSVDAACVCMALHAFPRVTALLALQELRRVAAKVIVADYCLAERSIAMPAALLAQGVEKLVGGEHYRCYTDFMSKGGIEALLYEAELAPKQRLTVLGGAARIVVV